MRLARRTTRTVTSLTLGMWLFALISGIASACLPGQPGAAHAERHNAIVASAHHTEDAAAVECASVCNEDRALFAKLQLVQDPPAGQAFLLAVQPFPLLAQPSVHIAPTLRAHPPPGVPLYLRSLRLAL
jgi:hypothetical protein